jgi:hypothetical protein
MDKTYPSEGLYDLDSRMIYFEAKKLFQNFFVEQTPLNAFKLSIILHHLLEWVVPNRDDELFLDSLKRHANENSLSLSPEGKLVSCLQEYEFYEVLTSIANNAKHFCLTRSKAYEKLVIEGFRAGQSVVGERVGQTNLAVDFRSKEVWLRDVFSYVLSRYAEYFRDSEGIYPN